MSDPIQAFNRYSLERYMKGPLFREVFFAALEEFRTLEAAFLFAMGALRNVDPIKQIEGGHILVNVFGVYFEPEDRDLESPVFIEDFLDEIEQDPDAFYFEEAGLLYQALQAGLDSGTRAIPTYAPELKLDYDQRAVMASLYYAMFVDPEGWVDLYDHPAEPPDLFAYVLEREFRKIFEPIDGRFFLESSHCASSACRGFWEYLGLWVDGYNRPVIDW